MPSAGRASASPLQRVASWPLNGAGQERDGGTCPSCGRRRTQPILVHRGYSTSTHTRGGEASTALNNRTFTGICPLCSYSSLPVLIIFWTSFAQTLASGCAFRDRLTSVPFNATPDRDQRAKLARFDRPERPACGALHAQATRGARLVNYLGDLRARRNASRCWAVITSRRLEIRRAKRFACEPATV